MDRERANRNSIHLYCTGPYWVAFERSAYQFCIVRSLIARPLPLRLFAYPFPIVIVSVTDRSLRSYIRPQAYLEKRRVGLQAIDRPQVSLGGLP